MARTAKKTVAKKAAAPKRPPLRSGAAQGGAAGAAAGAASAVVTPTGSYRAKVRMYRQGLGDCFLISLPRTDGGTRPFYVMIDCGVVLGTPNPAVIMKQVLDSIVQETDGAIDLLIATHEHWDHLSGFVQAKDSFDRLTKVGQVWLAWTEDPADELTKKLKDEKGQALAALRKGLNQMQAAGQLLDLLRLQRRRQRADHGRRAQQCSGQDRQATLLPADRPAGPARRHQCALLRARTAA